MEAATRFIPTSVGNTRSLSARIQFPTVHPHVCGEYLVQRQTHPVLIRFIPTCVGNTETHRMKKILLARFIPTCVGNTWGFLPDAQRAFGSSPRVWGIHRERNGGRSPSYGSSPRVWGILADVIQRLAIIRFIPTCVGNTSRSRPYLARQAVHPHVCGEYALTGSTVPPNSVHPHVCGEY